MLNQFIAENRIPYNDEKDQLKPIVNIKWPTLSERAISKIRTIFRKICSEIQIESGINYDDLCGPWVYSKNPLYSQYVDLPRPSLCIWKYFSEEDIVYLKKHQENKDIIRSFFGK
ncbi:PREDICTED: uncharacterized protein LOC108550988 [Eufriesea mexicana]|uniref:uncharacterized protein LOC108550988 n=1 Tax=Eufriesea mexicana TaxID=516756 RepID=UPI00083BC60C|nr:PREDICTED: uncharacterized protein LOC108550988 [Eufriesea mexicana]